MTREDRAHELQTLKITHPDRLISLYRAVNGLSELAELPPDVSFVSIIDTILTHEEAIGRISGEHRKGIP